MSLNLERGCIRCIAAVGEPITRTARPGDEIRIDDVRYAWPLDEDEIGGGIRCSWYY